MDPSFTLNPHQARPISLAATRVLPPANLRNGSIRWPKELDCRRTGYCWSPITLEVFRHAFLELGLDAAWERVIALVVQPGVEFGSNSIFEYDRTKAAPLSAALQSHPGLVYEAHSSDYQTQQALTYMVEDHFAI